METSLILLHGNRQETEEVKLPLVIEALLSARTADAVFVVDPEYRIVHWDARSESLTGLLAEEAVGKPSYEVLSGESDSGESFSSHEYSAMQLALAGHSAPGYDMRVTTRHGGRRWVGVSNLSVDTEEGTYLVHILRDVHQTHETLEMARGLIWVASERSVPAKKAPDPRDVPTLTPRQLEVLELLETGKSVREIGRELYLSQATVRNHVRSLLQALDAHSQLEALAQARKLGLLGG